MTTWNWRAQPVDCLYLDFETQSLVDIRKSGGRKYVYDPSTRISLCGFKYGTQQTVWVNEAVQLSNVVAPEGWTLHVGAAPPQWVLDRINDGTVLCAHNALEFDEPVWRRFIGIDASWVDCLPFTRAAGLPGSLDKTSKLLFNVGKHEAHQLKQLLCNPKIVGTTSAWNAFIAYCAQDVALLEQLYERVYQFAEPEILEAHRRCMERGIPIDRTLALKLALLNEELTTERSQDVSEATGIDADDVRSTAKIKLWLESVGVRLPRKNHKASLDKNVLNVLFKQPELFGADSDVVETLKTRLEVTGTAGSKALAMARACDEDNRARWQIVYGGAHTLRFSGRQSQPHNLPRGVKGLDLLALARKTLTLDEVKVAAKQAGCSCASVLSSLLRSVITKPNMRIADYGAVEARCLAWLVNDENELALYRQRDADPYLPMASTIFGRAITKEDAAERWVGKAVILGAGYSMSWLKFDAFCAVQGVSLSDIGVDPKAVVQAYRRTHPAVVQGWDSLQDAVFSVVSREETEAEACRCKFHMVGCNLHAILPSGRPIVYRNARIEQRVPAYLALYGLPEVPSDQAVFQHPHGYEGTLYGGRIMENVDQGTCRDIMAEHLVEAERADLRPFLHVHDEIVTEAGTLRDLVSIMSTPPKWAAGFPLLVEGFTCDRYLKGAPKGVPTLKGLCSELW